MRARSCLRMVLHREGGFVLYPYAFYGTIIQVHMGYLHTGRFFYSLRVYTKAVVLCSDLCFARDQVFNRMVQPAVAVVHFKSRYVVGARQQLVAQAYAKKWFIGGQYI